MRTLIRVVIAVLAALVLPAAVAAATTLNTFANIHPARAEAATPASAINAAPVAHDPAKRTAVVVIGDRGAVASDVLAPYEVLAQTGAFNVYTVAPQRRPLTLSGGLDIVPDLTFADLDARLGGAVPDVVVVPAMPDVGEPTTAPVTSWLRQEAQRGALMLTICNGSGVLASTGLLDGRDATAHWIRIGKLTTQFPAVNWVRGPRFVDEGNIVTTAGILSGIDGTLWVVERLAGQETAARAAAAIGWHRYVPGGQTPGTSERLAAPDSVVVLNAGYRWDRSTFGVVLTEGVGELELASVFDSYGAQAYAARTVAVSQTGDVVRSRHGLVFAPRSDLRSAAPQLDRLLVPGADAARRHDVDAAGFRGTPEYLHERPGFAYDAAVSDIARSFDVMTARWTAKVLEYPADGIELSGPSWPWQIALRPIALALLGLTAAFAVDRLVRTRLVRARRGRAHDKVAQTLAA